MGKKLWFFLILAFILVSCGGSEAQVTPQATLPLLYYHTSTPSSAESIPTLAVEPTRAPKATSTPFIYVVVQNDTLSVIASRFGVTLEDLLAVNPGVDPNAMVIGTQLIIPGKEGETVSLQPGATAVPVQGTELRCYSTSAGGMWCFWLVHNDSGQPVENLAASITLYNQDGKPLRSETALGPLNLLRKGDQMPLVVYFTPPVPDWAEARADLQTSLPVSNVAKRYLVAKVEDLQVTVSEDGLWAQVTGGVRLEDDKAQASLVWVLVTAYDAEGHVVGVRRWDNEQGINAGKKRAFEVNVYSLGPDIDHVELLVEARP